MDQCVRFEVMAQASSRGGTAATPIVWYRRIGLALLVAAAVLTWASLTAEASATLLAKYGMTLFGIEVALAVFSVNLSLVIFQLSPYRHLVPGMSRRHLLLAATVLVVSLGPLALAPCGPATIGRGALALSPFSAFGGFLVGMMAQREAHPMAIVRRSLSRRRRRTFLDACEAFAAVESKRHQEEIERSEGGPPTHEIGHRDPLPPTAVDPFDVCVNVIAHGVRTGELIVVDRALESLLGLGTVLQREADNRGDEVRWTVENHWPRVLNRIHAIANEDPSGEAGGRSVLRIGQFLREQQSRGMAVNDISIDALASARRTASALLEKDRSHEAVSLLVDIRHVVNTELRGQPDIREKYALGGYADSVGALGSASVDVENLHVLYTCLDALAWIGCDAVRLGNDDMARSCLQSLTQLGRKARASRLECFWSHCALTPTDHAEERLRWIASWLPKFPGGGRDSLSASVATAFSRLTGVEFQVSVESVNPPRIRLGPVSDKPYIESFSSDTKIRELDYSDHTMLKELRLW